MTFRALRGFAFGLTTLLAWYAGSYVLMMDWRRPAYDPAAGRDLDQSAYRCAPLALIHPWSPDFHNIYMVRPCVCWANHVFWPIDLVVRRLTAPLDPRARGLVVGGYAVGQAVLPVVAEKPIK